MFGGLRVERFVEIMNNIIHINHTKLGPHHIFGLIMVRSSLIRSYELFQSFVKNTNCPYLNLEGKFNKVTLPRSRCAFYFYGQISMWASALPFNAQNMVVSLVITFIVYSPINIYYVHLFPYLHYSQLILNPVLPGCCTNCNFNF